MKSRLILASITVFGALGLSSAPASAQATRTWVSGVGDDANPCSRTAPCKTFAGAISKTATGGEINCLDPAGFGGVTLTKSISIVCDFTEGGILSAGAGVNGIIVNLPSVNDSVFLSGLDLNGAGNAQNGIRIVSGGNVHIQNSIIRNYRAANGLGMSVQPAAALVLTVNNTTIANNGQSGVANGGGILIQPTGANGSARVQLDRVRLLSNSNASIRVDTTGNTAPAGIQMTLRNSQMNNSTNGLTITASGAGAAQANVFDTEIFNNQPGSGLVVNGASALIRAGGNTIMGNGAALQISGGGSIRSYGDNITDGNSNVSTFTAPNLTPQ